jgi:hypothetical protein
VQGWGLEVLRKLSWTVPGIVKSNCRKTSREMHGFSDAETYGTWLQRVRSWTLFRWLVSMISELDADPWKCVGVPKHRKSEAIYLGTVV